jgi:hypothetical protein
MMTKMEIITIIYSHRPPLTCSKYSLNKECYLEILIKNWKAFKTISKYKIVIRELPSGNIKFKPSKIRKVNRK